MFYAIVLVALTGLCSAADFNSELDNEWTLYRKFYNKTYMYGEELMRRKIWEQNLEYVNKHNLEADRGVHTFWLGMNKFADMTNEEFVKTMNTLKPSNRVNGSTYLRPSHVALPDSVDWRPEGYVTGVKDQGACGSCWAFSATGSLEGQTFKKTGNLVSLSEQNLMDCDTKDGNMGCLGGLMDTAFEYIIKNNGIDTEESYPYEGTEGKCRFDPANVGATLTGYMKIKSRDEDDLQSAVATVGPISVAMDASKLSFQLYRDGVYESSTCSQYLLNHAVLAIGYGAEGGKDYWLIKNSWGTGWGNQGYAKMSRNNNNNCGIATDASYPVV